MSSFRRFRAELKSTSAGFNNESENQDPNYVSPGVLQSARGSGQLNLSSRGLTTIPEGVYNIMDLSENPTTKSFSLSGNSGRWWESVDLTRLVMSNNAITSVDARIINLAALAMLDLSHNQLTTLPKEIAELKGLQTVNLTDNLLTDIPEGLFALDLVELRMARNSLTTIPGGHMATWATSLARLDLSENQLTELPADLGQLSSLTNLNVAKNKLEVLPTDWWQCARLLDLNAAENRLRCLFLLPPQSLPPKGSIDIRLDRLTSLDLHSNTMVSPVGLGVIASAAGTAPSTMDLTGLRIHMGNLKELSLSYNRLVTLGPLVDHCPGLLTLDANANKLTSLPVAIYRLGHISRLDISANEFSQLPLRLGLLDSLKVLLFAGNPFRVYSLGNNTSTMLSRLRNRLSPEDIAGSFEDPLGPVEVALVPWTQAVENEASSPDQPIGSANNAPAAEIAPPEPATAVEEPTPPAEPTAPEVEPESLAVAVASSTPLLHAVIQPTIHKGDSDEPSTSSAIPDNFEDQHIRLLTLRLASLGLTQLAPQDIDRIPFQPRDVQLARNALPAFPRSLIVSYHNSLTYLDLSHNRITTFPWWTAAGPEGDAHHLPQLPSLRVLNLSNNRITEWPALVQELPLEANGQPGVCPDLMVPVNQLPFPNLQELVLADNLLTKTPIYPVQSLFPKLDNLNLDHNKVTSIPFPTAFKGLLRLNLANNDIGSIPATLGLNTTLQTLSLEGNSFLFPRFQTLRLGTLAVLEYLRDRIPRSS
ncbi:hypothetical protein BJ085DRAFT_33863 [Dimargaris cristalligena]|uniref:L domain-like protein n=1 Tax=Dimargaris cristalligena TaxID=215637 RepID=A0A4Q0A420_9FUNG|nr:hypothetical protein BJ085DRAFT_33863 [Dimargaris cristalligena]|eukprot:RKP40152.1 hypothetical protein BJ085DRAFT_33863 [Dimargaris cristalligena]